MRSCRVITACCVLFNLAKDFKEPILEGEDVPLPAAEEDALEVEQDNDINGVAVRSNIVATFV